MSTAAPTSSSATPDSTRSSAALLSSAEREAYRSDGFFVREACFDPVELDALRSAAERVVTRVSSAPRDDRYEIDGHVYLETSGSTVQLEHLRESRTVRVIEPFHHLDPLLGALVADPRLVDPMCALLGASRVALYTDKLNLKRPREGSGFRWHQDSPYWLQCPHVGQLPNVWIALDDADRTNGCLQLVRGSHREGMLPGLEGEGRLGPLFTDPAHFDVKRACALEVEAGSLVFFSPHIVHGSEPNGSGAARRALVVTYQPPGHPMFKRPGVLEFEAGRRPGPLTG